MLNIRPPLLGGEWTVEGISKGILDSWFSGVKNYFNSILSCLTFDLNSICDLI